MPREKEILAGLNDSEDAREHVMLYSRHITDVPGKLQSVYDDSPKSILNLFSGNSHLKTLRQELLALVKNKVEKTLSYDTLHSEEYSKVFEEDIYRMLERLVLKEVNTYAGVSEIESEREKNQIFAMTELLPHPDSPVSTIGREIPFEIQVDMSSTKEFLPIKKDVLFLTNI